MSEQENKIYIVGTGPGDPDLLTVKAKRLLDLFGIDEIEAGTPVMGDDEQETIRQIVALRLKARISVINSISTPTTISEWRRQT
jgi:homocitrate synthase NifV